MHSHKEPKGKEKVAALHDHDGGLDYDLDSAVREEYERVEPRLDYRGTVTSVSGPLIVIDKVRLPKYAEMVHLTLGDGSRRRGRVVEVAGDRAVVMVLEGTHAIDTSSSSPSSSSGTVVQCTGEVMRLGVSEEMVGRVFDGCGEPIDRGARVMAHKYLDIEGQPMNPCMIAYPDWMIETGISSIDVMTSLACGSRLPIISSPGMPHNEIAAQICRQARLVEPAQDDPSGGFFYRMAAEEQKHHEQDQLVIVFAAIGVSTETARFFKNDFEENANMGRTIMFVNLATDSIIERLVTPKVALTAAEYLAFECDKHVLVILCDMTAYGQALCEVAAMRGEPLRRRGYPSNIQSDLASIYARAGNMHGRKGSLTQMPVVTVVNEDYTHPMVDLTYLLCDGGLWIDRGLHDKRIYPPIDLFYSYSRFCRTVSCSGRTRADHYWIGNQMYVCYVRGKEKAKFNRCMNGDAGLSEEDRVYAKYVEQMEREFIDQGPYECRSLYESLDMAWRHLRLFRKDELRCIPHWKIDQYYYRGTNSEDSDE